MLTCVADVYAVLHLSVRVAKYLSVLMKFAPERAVKKKMPGVLVYFAPGSADKLYLLQLSALVMKLLQIVEHDWLTTFCTGVC